MERLLKVLVAVFVPLALACGIATSGFAQTLAGDAEATKPTIQVDPEVDSLLVRADQLAARKEFDLAATLWQKLLDESGHHLLSTDGERYVPLRELVFQKLAALPPSARAVYRITADGEARGLLEAAKDDPSQREVALAETVRRFFLSSLGDDAAFELAGIALDRRDFVTASRLTRAIQQRHPDPNVPKGQVLLRQAVADAYLGDRRGADAALDRLEKLPARDRGTIEVAAIRGYLAKEVYPRRGVSLAKRMTDELRTNSVSLGVQPDLPPGMVGGALTEHLAQEWSLPHDHSGPNSVMTMWVGRFATTPSIMYASRASLSEYESAGMVARSSSYLSPDVSATSMTFELDGGFSVSTALETFPPVGEGFLVTPHVQTIGGGVTAVGEFTDEERRAALTRRWRERLWHPTSQLLPVAGGFVFRSSDDVTMWDLERGQLKQRWQSKWNNAPLASGSSPVFWSDAASNGMLSSQESILFGDGLALAASAQGDLLFVLEGVRQPRESEEPEEPEAEEPKTPSTKTPERAPPALTPTPEPATEPVPATPAAEGTPRIIVEEEEPGVGGVEQAAPVAASRQRKNFLAAYEQKTGKLIWRRAAEDTAKIQSDEQSPEQGGDEAGFIGPPVAWNDRLLIPVLSGGSFSLMAISVHDGALLWKTPLSDEPDSGTSMRSASCVAIAGGDAYVVLGSGMVFALDARSGAIHWGARYVRDVVAVPQQMNPYGGQQQQGAATFQGWESDAVVVSGNTLLVLASDHDHLLALDRRTGEVKWRSPRRLPSGTSARYCLGTIDRRLFVAGVDVVRAYDMPSGRLEWEQVIRPTTGHGALTSQAIYLPILGTVDGAVLSLDPNTGRELGQSSVTLTRPEPLGNLHSDGERLWVAGANRLFALTHVPHQLQELSRGVEERRVNDVLQRARLLARLKRFDEALADVRLAYELLVAKDPHGAAAMLDILATGKLAHERPLQTLQLIAACKGVLAANAPAELVQARDQMTRSALGAMQRKPIPSTVAEILRMLPDLLGTANPELVDTPRIIDSAARAIDRAASNDDLPVLREALKATEASQSMAAIPAFVTRAADADLQLVATLLKSDHLGLRLAAAKSLALAKGRRTALATLIDLLDTDDTTQRRQALGTLRSVAGAASPELFLDASAEERTAGIALWRKWLGTLQGDLPAPIVRQPGREVIDRVLVTLANPGRLMEFTATGREIWRRGSLPYPTACAGTSEGHCLVLIHGGRQIVEFDADGQQVWQSGLLPFAARSLERLPDGNTLVACPQRDALLEIAPDGHLVATTTVRGNPGSAQRLDDRRTLVSLMGTGRVVEVTHEGETIWEAAEFPGVTDARRLSTGQTFVVQLKTGALTLLNRTGQPVAWPRSGVKALVGAVHRANGTTVFADATHLEWIGSGGQSKWSEAMTNITGIAGN